MNKLTAEKCRELLAERYRQRDSGDISIVGIYTLQALEIALPVLEQQERLLSLMPPSYCIKCNNTGQMDGGGTQPWGDAIMVTCDCQQPSTTSQIDNDGWIEWGGGECPVDRNSQVDVKFSGPWGGIGRAGSMFWSHDGGNSDIIAYRVIENDGREA